MGDLSRRISEFETGAPLVSHEAHATYLENLEMALRAAAVMFGQDGDLGGTWLRKRKPKKGRFLHLRERIQFGRRTRAHGRHGSDALVKAADKVRDLARFHEDFMAHEKKTQADSPGRGRHAR